MMDWTGIAQDAYFYVMQAYYAGIDPESMKIGWVLIVEEI